MRSFLMERVGQYLDVPQWVERRMLRQQLDLQTVCVFGSPIYR
jgi:hypothetical protein